MNIQALMQQAQTMQKKVEANVETAKKDLANKYFSLYLCSSLPKGRQVL